MQQYPKIDSLIQKGKVSKSPQDSEQWFKQAKRKIEQKECDSFYGEFTTAEINYLQGNSEEALNSLTEQLDAFDKQLPSIEIDGEHEMFTEGIYQKYVKFWSRGFISEECLQGALSTCNETLIILDNRWSDPLKTDIRKILNLIGKALCYQKSSDPHTNGCKGLNYQLTSFFLDPTHASDIHQISHTLTRLDRHFDAIILLQYGIQSKISNQTTTTMLENLYKIKKMI
ncbi:MAG: hypothetical protein G01um101418_620 [Parcubacteria group bacterium Gr01-1014_18]|nr:MAG: hypothetical protein Greene041636_89 [Parcubacteria group bacterium Greene0416_36]TSC80872.1 MAG: hypothetical protein G01um101418_620 [Parcubacteria group bacterium Gr01-1014_18]TSC99533.1 MAG: hypothetical protein Greene101420_200 [Parcubacteria group bacterium Greene1014_20]TSD07548.1 MAG: hypothetical protein Greene07142_5 [Parcubacteria group bacterium Greene0714_2]